MQTYVILRRRAWSGPAEADEAHARSAVEAERHSEVLQWIRSYGLVEADGTMGSVCIYEAASPEAVRRHAAAADLPVEEIVKVEEVIVVRPDPVPEQT
jgi:hypothetical protein